MLTENIFRAFINKDNINMNSALKKVFFIYSKQQKKKKLYYFMKLLLHTLKAKRKKNNYSIKYNKLYNDYTSQKRNKQNIKYNYINNESDLNPFSPYISNRSYISYTPKNVKIKKMPSLGYFGKSYYSGNKFPINQKLNYFNKRNIKDNEFYNYENNKEMQMPYESYRNNNNTKRYNSTIKVSKFPNNKISYTSRINDDINKQIYQYLNNFEEGKSQNFPSKNMIHEKYKNNGKELNKNKIRSSNYTFNKGNYFNKKNPYLINNSEITFNKNAKREIELKYRNEALNYLNNNKSKTISHPSGNKNKNKNNKNNKIIYNDSYNYLNNINSKNKSIKDNILEKELNNKDKNNSNKSLNPSLLGIDQTKTFYTNQQRNSNNNIRSGNALISNINSLSRLKDSSNNHFLNGIKISSGVNEYFYDFNQNYKNNNEEQKFELSMQSLSDSKILELAGKYITEDENSSENYQMNNILHSKKKYKNKNK